MIPIHFDQERSRSMLDCLANGRPIEGVKTVSDMVMLAGACFFVALTHGPHLLGDAARYQAQPLEHQEASNETLFAELHAAIEFYAQLHQQAYDNEYPHEPQLTAIVGVKGDGTRFIVPHKGFRASEE